MLPHRPPSSLLLRHARKHFAHNSQVHTQPASPIERLKRPARAGQNLSDRFRRLENMLLAKHSLTQTITADALRARMPIPVPIPTTLRKLARATFRGLVLPEEPKAPGPDDCCMSGCAICVHDLYQDSLAAYAAALASVRASLASMDVPVAQWPARIRLDADTAARPKASTVLSAFEEFERALEAKRAAQSS
ncbi:hypothetical protein BC834DRAFT_248232 [Gloeopeniophorella convolvens]|nr:hypothetical protein BC834DRAFT_248232 [Gloeopeniophorella convolvens]